eukprot:COSAG06_NODE_4727_length_3951_cov_2.075897_2_plen_169_part_00
MNEKTTRENTIERTQTHTDRLALPALAYVFAYVFAYVSLLQTVRQSAQTYIVLCGLPEGKHTHLLRHFILKRIILARQARDKHRESTQKEMVRFLVSQARWVSGCVSRGCGKGWCCSVRKGAFFPSGCKHCTLHPLRPLRPLHPLQHSLRRVLSLCLFRACLGKMLSF